MTPTENDILFSEAHYRLRNKFPEALNYLRRLNVRNLRDGQAQLLEEAIYLQDKLDERKALHEIVVMMYQVRTGYAKLAEFRSLVETLEMAQQELEKPDIIEEDPESIINPSIDIDSEVKDQD